MKRLDAVLLKVFLWGLPIVAAAALFDHLLDERLDGGYLKIIYDMNGFLLAAWMILAVYLSARLVFSGEFRERVLSKLTFLKERDEREAHLAGRAMKVTMLTSLAVLILLFCLSCFQVAVFKLPPEKAADGKTRGFSLGLKFHLLNEPGDEWSRAPVRQYDLFSYSGLPISTSGIVLLLIVWQIIVYNCTIRRLAKGKAA